MAARPDPTVPAIPYAYPLHVQPISPQRARGGSVALAVLICGTVALALSSHTHQHAAAPTLASTPRVASDTRADPSAAARSRSEDQRVRRIAAVVAKRYRVANDATRSFVEIAYREAKRNRLDPLLVLAVIAVESRFDPRAESEGGAMGLMQVIPRYHVQNAQDATRAAMLDPDRNIGLGTRVLKQYVRAGGTEAAGLQRYNGSADDTTHAYANKVMAEKRLLRDAVRDLDAGARA